ncbi:hypothetical protein BJ138DRAFT_1107395 [Hygrophoropsis aurantiaca]|uniref:Uncharacterized protein n=1 Tax=Hygrophoropsis aurantiaca TaxID=72124 RepID=A0ACB7ZRE3_9AGAM|nr:hypothetical protein BJ138DRAFT_1107395 [Hygrophoropsis aurantiaca]
MDPWQEVFQALAPRNVEVPIERRIAPNVVANVGARNHTIPIEEQKRMMREICDAVYRLENLLQCYEQPLALNGIAHRHGLVDNRTVVNNGGHPMRQRSRLIIRQRAIVAPIIEIVGRVCLSTILIVGVYVLLSSVANFIAENDFWGRMYVYEILGEGLRILGIVKRFCIGRAIF